MVKIQPFSHTGHISSGQEPPEAVATILGSVDTEHFCHHRKFYCAALLYTEAGNGNGEFWKVRGAWNHQLCREREKRIPKRKWNKAKGKLCMLCQGLSLSKHAFTPHPPKLFRFTLANKAVTGVGFGSYFLHCVAPRTCERLRKPETLLWILRWEGLRASFTHRSHWAPSQKEITILVAHGSLSESKSPPLGVWELPRHSKDIQGEKNTFSIWNQSAWGT